MEAITLNKLWQWVCRTIPDETRRFSLGSSVVHESVFIAINLFLFLCYKFNWFAKYRIQGSNFPEWKLLKKTMWVLALSHAFQGIILRPGYPLLVFIGLRSQATDVVPSFHIIALQLLGCMLIEDCLFYWTHRMLHHRLLYKHIHKLHHEYKTPIGPSAEYAHPVETIITVLLPSVIAPVLVQPHLIVFWIWSTLRLVESTYAHSGFHVWWFPFNILPFQGGAERHDFHHSKNVGSYGSFFNFWDWVTGTDKPFKQWLEERGRVSKVAKSK
eukprot:TRINITY_DN7635_c0_g1_i1.p1 TRINITY_DN7635_c0_g1~~TRINITY_DN7635_c0_g1_i1.p1  ORF type:complete len:271 (+),score=28.59 TRINITY_DN7635_c0_g1_i1:131-943(+)